jgi:tetratricopeptide (TPR) repeat protein
VNTYLIKPFITVCLALLFALGGLAQDQSKIDSLNVACGELKPDSNRVNCLIELSGEWLVADPTTSLQYSTLALELAQSLGHQEILIKAHKATALSHGYLLDPESSKPHYLEAIKLLDQLGDENRKGNMYLNLGADYIYTAQYDSCMHYLLKALPIYRSVGNKLGVSKVHNNLAIAYRHMGYFNEAISTYRQSIAYKKEVDNREGWEYTSNFSNTNISPISILYFYSLFLFSISIFCF